MVINNSTSVYTDKLLNNIFIAGNLIESAMSQTSLERERLAESEQSKEEKHSSLEPQPELKERLRYDKESDGYYLRKRLIVNGLAENGYKKEESKMFMCSSPLAVYTQLDILEDEHKVFDEMPTK